MNKYEYDTNGNILSKTNLVTESTIEYFYDGNRLMRYNSPVDNFVYDAIGNPTIYRGEPMKWDFKNLRAFKNTSFTYDASGLRKAKINKNQTTTYYWAEDQLLAERRTIDGFYIPQVGFHIPKGGFRLNEEKYVHLDYVYGVTGILGFTLQRNNGALEKYWYTKNIQGDVTHIYKEVGNTKTLVASYSYDTWGNHAVTVDVDGIGSLNPIRYRGYYYDMETGLYYLKTRYYDPETGRFISPDNIDVLDVTKDMVNGLNLYAYCGNDPINDVDSSGMISFKSIGKWFNKNIVKPVGNLLYTSIVQPINNIEVIGDFFFDEVLGIKDYLEGFVNDPIGTLTNDHGLGGLLVALVNNTPIGKFVRVLERNVFPWLDNNEWARATLDILSLIPIVGDFAKLINLPYKVSGFMNGTSPGNWIRRQYFRYIPPGIRL